MVLVVALLLISILIRTSNLKINFKSLSKIIIPRISCFSSAVSGKDSFMGAANHLTHYGFYRLIPVTAESTARSSKQYSLSSMIYCHSLPYYFEGCNRYLG